MRNGGLPPAYLPSSSLSDPLAWLQYKWSQPPPRAPEWVFDDFQNFNPPANVGRHRRGQQATLPGDGRAGERVGR
jgi:hypothetical protein